MKNFNYNSYQAYHPRNTPQQQHQQQQQQQNRSFNCHNNNYHSNRHHNQQQLTPPTQQQLQFIQQQQQPTHSNQPKLTSNVNSTISLNNMSASATAISTQMASLKSATFLQNHYMNNNSNSNSNSNNNINNNNNNHNNFTYFNFNHNNNNTTTVINNYDNNLLQHYQQQPSPQLNSQNPHHLHQQQEQQQQQQQQHMQMQQLQLQKQHHEQQQQSLSIKKEREEEESQTNICGGSGSGGGNDGCSDKFTMDACEIANFLANELFMQQLVSMDGIQSGVPTLTTSTLTPTTLRSIEETFIQLTSEPINAPYQAGFIPPPIQSIPSTSINVNSTGFNSSLQDYDINESDSENSQNSWNPPLLNEDNSLATTDTSSAATDSLQNGMNGLSNHNNNNSLATSNASSTNDFTAVNIAIAAAAASKNSGFITTSNNNTSNSATSHTTTTRRNQGGRRPTKSTNATPEEEEKRRIRRERNKLAAARCRKRRVDQTNDLLEEVADLEKKREVLQKNIEMLNTTKQDLEFILEAHRPTCQKIRQDILSVNTFGGLIAPTTNSNSNDSNSTIIGKDTTLSSAARCISPLDIKPVMMGDDNMLDVVQQIKNEPLDSALDSNSSLDHDGPSSPKRMLLTNNNPMIPPPLPNVATLSPSLAAASASLNTPIVTTAPVNFGSFANSAATLNTLNTLNALNSKPINRQRPNSLPTMPRMLAQNLALNIDGKPPTDINGVDIQTPSTGMFNFDSLMNGGTGLTPLNGPLVPTCSSQNHHPLELTTPTSEPSKLVSL